MFQLLLTDRDGGDVYLPEYEERTFDSIPDAQSHLYRIESGELTDLADGWVGGYVVDMAGNIVANSYRLLV